MNRWSALALLLAVAGALALRSAQLDARPLHGDEAVNATKLATLCERGEYKYDPHEFHGPTLYYAARLITPSTFTDGQLRHVTVVFGVGLILILFLLKDALGQLATACAAILLAVSPAMVFYSRYFIHEMALVFFTLLTIAAGWRYSRSRQPGWAALTGAGVGLMFATKETFVFSVVAMIAALFATAAWNPWWAKLSTLEAGSPASGPARLNPTPPGHINAVTGASFINTATGIGAAAMVWLLLFSSFFGNWQGLPDSFKTYSIWLERAGGNSPHIHPWSFYLERLAWFHPPKSPVWSEAAILILAAAGAIASFISNRAAIVQPGFARFLAFYTFVLTVIYSAISYKTPWCLLNFWLGAILLAGIGAAALIQLLRNPLAHVFLVCALITATVHLAFQSWRASTTYAASPKNPWVYAHTSVHARELVERVKSIAHLAPDGFATPIKVVAPESYWPLPWYLRNFKNAGWWDSLPDEPLAPIVLVSAKLDAKLDGKPDKTHIMTGLYELRPGVFLELYVERSLWEKFIATLPREAD